MKAKAISHAPSNFYIHKNQPMPRYKRIMRKYYTIMLENIKKLVSSDGLTSGIWLPKALQQPYNASCQSLTVMPKNALLRDKNMPKGKFNLRIDKVLTHDMFELSVWITHSFEPLAHFSIYHIYLYQDSYDLINPPL